MGEQYQYVVVTDVTEDPSIETGDGYETQDGVLTIWMDGSPIRSWAPGNWVAIRRLSPV